jgi:hypothetical protein
MASTLIETLGQEIDRISALYESSFAGQSRATRDLDELDMLIKRVQDVIAKVTQIPSAAQGPELARVREIAQANLKIYETEKTAIKDAKAAGPDFEDFARLANTANFVFARYYRHFAGKDRVTRDVGLLAEMVEDLKHLRQRMVAMAAKNPAAAFKKDVDLVASTLEMYQSEIREITKAQTMGTQDEQASALASLANSQFAIYRSHFASKSRVTRRPALLQRVVDNLRRTRERMTDLRKGGLEVDYNAKNIEIVEQNLATYETEMVEIRKARQGTKMDDIMGMLGSAANELFEEYRKGFAGKDRTSVSLDQLSLICDQLGEIAGQMTDLSRAETNDMNERNLEIVMDQLSMFEREFEAIVEAQKNAATRM